MTLLTTTNNVGGILPPEFGALVWEPVEAAAVALNPSVATVVNTGSTTFHIPVVTEDAGAAWLLEGDEIDPDNPDLDEIVVTPAKVGGLARVSRELATDSSPAAQTIVGTSIARSIAHRIDAAFLSSLGAPAPEGLADLTGYAEVDAAGFENLDPLAEAISDVETAGGTVTAFITDPATALILSTMKTADDSNAPLLGVDATNGTARTPLGVPLLVSPHVTAGTVWAVDRSAVYTVVRQGVELAVSTDAYFSSDRIGVRATARVGFAFPVPGRIARIGATSS